MVDFKEDYVLENEVAKLSPLKEGAIEQLRGFALDEPNLWQYSLLSASGEDNMNKYIAAALKDKATGCSYPFIVYDKRNQKVAGSTRFYDYQKGHNTIQLGYTWYGKAFQGTGLNKNCKFLMLSFAFDRVKVERVEFRADANNERSIAAMKSLGCQVEGILRSNCAAPDGRRNSIVLSILKEEWYTTGRDMLLKKIKR